MLKSSMIFISNKENFTCPSKPNAAPDIRGWKKEFASQA